MTIAPETFRFALDRETGVATLTLDRPAKLNALTFDVYAELRDAFDAIDAAPEVRAVVLTGAGRAFCSGGDVDEIIGPLLDRDPDALLAFTRLTCDLVRAIRGCRKPVVAAVNGTAAGAGAVIAAACDVRIAAEGARIAFLFTRVGLSGADMGIAWLLPRLVGLGRATELLLTGAFVDAAEAWRIGLVNRVVPADGLAGEATALAERLARGPAHGIAITKAMLDREAPLELGAALEAEARAQADCMEHPDFREAYHAFRQKRAPEFG